MPAKAQKAEALGQSVAVEFGGDTYIVPPSSEWDIDVLEAVDDQRFTVALRALLGPEQWATFRAKHKKVSQLSDFFEAVGQAVGTGNP